MELTPSQKKALDLDRHLAIVANAGSGKTAVLVQRYIHILETHPELMPRNIVAITFTESAAAELRERIVKEIDVREAVTLPTDLTILRRYASIRDQIPGAYISTIHSFATRLLRSYPVEANIDAQFGIVQGADQKLLIEESLGSIFFRVLKEAFESEAKTGTAPRELDSFRAIGRKNMLSIVRGLLENRARVQALRDGFLAKSDNEVVDFWLEKTREAFDPSLVQQIHDLVVSALPAMTGGKNGKMVQEVLADFRTGADLFTSAAQFKRLFGCALTNDGTLSGTTFPAKKLPPELATESAALAVEVKKARQIADILPVSEEQFCKEHAEYLAHTRTILSIYDRVLEEYTESKASLGVLDFDDLIFGCKKLLEATHIREELQQQFRFVMIDEFQDTDETQYEIAKLITGEFGDRNRLAIVGDPKQSIYGFRNAETSVFQKTKEAISKQSLTRESVLSAESLGMTAVEQQGALMLRESFRMAPQPLAVINHLFRDLMSGDGGANDYVDLVHGRTGDLAGSVEWLVTFSPTKSAKPSEGDEVVPEERLSSDDLKTKEGELVAARILAMVTSEHALEVEDKQGRRPARFGDIAILLQSRTVLFHLERGLRHKGVPYQVSKGIGFFSQQEVQDLIGYLRFLSDPDKDIPLAGILRSPLFGWSDLDLFRVAEHPANKQMRESFWERCIRFVEESEHANAIHRRALSQLRENLVLAGRLGTSKLLAKICDETGLRISLRTLPNGAQMVANLEKLIRIARAEDARSFRSLHDLVDLLDYLSENEAGEAEAEVDPSDDRVQIMTIHAAKGLEFPIVFLPYLGQNLNRSASYPLDRELGIAFTTSGLVSDQFTQSSESDEEISDTPESGPVIRKIIRDRAKTKDLQEKKRVLYVAMTRARDHLILSAVVPEKSWGNKSLQMLEAMFGVQLRNPESTAWSFETEIEHYPDREGGRILVEIPFHREDIWQSTTVQSTSESSSLDLTYLPSVPLIRRSDRFSATQFLTYRECPTKYYLAYTLGMPEEPKLAYDLEPEELAESVRGKLAGQAIHTVLEKVGVYYKDGVIDHAKLDAVIARIFLDLGILHSDETDELTTRIYHDIGKIANHPILRELSNATESFAEFRLQTPINRYDQLLGIIDRLYKGPDGNWTILDYKTDTNANPIQREHSLTQYKFQLSLYAFLIHKFDSTADDIRAVILYTYTGEAREFRFQQSDLQRIEAECSELITSIRRDEEVKDLIELYRNYEHCPNCPFFDEGAKRCIVEVAAGQEQLQSISQ